MWLVVSIEKPKTCSLLMNISPGTRNVCTTLYRILSSFGSHFLLRMELCEEIEKSPLKIINSVSNLHFKHTFIETVIMCVWCQWKAGTSINQGQQFNVFVGLTTVQNSQILPVLSTAHNSVWIIFTLHKILFAPKVRGITCYNVTICCLGYTNLKHKFC